MQARSLQLMGKKPVNFQENIQPNFFQAFFLQIHIKVFSKLHLIFLEFISSFCGSII